MGLKLVYALPQNVALDLILGLLSIVTLNTGGGSLYTLYTTLLGWSSALACSHTIKNAYLAVIFSSAILLGYFLYRLNSSIYLKTFNHAVTGMALLSLDGQLLKVNPSLCKMLGFSKSELLAKTVQDIIQKNDWDHDLIHINKVLAEKGRVVYQTEKEFCCKNGEIVWALLLISLVRHPQGRPLYFIAQVQDVLEPKTNEHWIVDKMVNLTAQLHSEIGELKFQEMGNSSIKVERILAEIEFFSANL